MNPLLKIKLNFNDEKLHQQPGARNLKAQAGTNTGKIDTLLDSLKDVLRFYSDHPPLTAKLMIDICYNDIIAKSSRVRALFKPERGSANDTVVGARFSDAPEGQENHIITHYVDRKTVEQTIADLRVAKSFLQERLGGEATRDNFQKPHCKIDYSGFGLAENKLRDVIIDCSVVDRFGVPRLGAIPDRESFLITFYRSELSISRLMEKLNIDRSKFPYTPYGEDTISVTRELFNILSDKVPYLISMISTDISQLTLEDLVPRKVEETYEIPAPQHEPVIGVIDTFFDESVYFHEWVENHDYIDDTEKYLNDLGQRDHGTEVTSLIVDGPRLNPWLEDGCGRFRVRHFGICSDKISILRLVRKVKDIVNENPDIHVWNLSLGTDEEVSRNFVSVDAAVLDEIQSQKNVIFIVAGTNDNRATKTDRLRVGSPADSLNSLVVNSVTRGGAATSYSRKGPILSFYNKPDVSYYGGDFNDRICVCAPYGREEVYGTSFAAPWISRKMCYLIDVLGLPKEVAKALIIDAAAAWDYSTAGEEQRTLAGYGVVPIEIEKIVSSPEDEIRFVVFGTSASYRTANYSIPVPKDDGKYPYVARATLCYFPPCSRSQGVDYTNRELSLKFGRVKNEQGEIIDINENVQDTAGHCVSERQSRREFRKWDNTKFISKVIDNNNLKKYKPVKTYHDFWWGLTVTSKERLTGSMRNPLNFGLVFTLKELNGVNRIDEFIRACTIRGCIVNKLEIEHQLNIYASGQEEVRFE